MAAITEFKHEEGHPLTLSPEILKAWRTDGVIIARNLLLPNEVEKLKLNLECEALQRFAYETDDGTGLTKSRFVLWNQPGRDVSGVIARSEKVVHTAEQILGEEVFHYHSKLVAKQPHTGGVFQWHQDYGYWYKNGHLTPDMCTVFIAVDRCDTENGCIEVMPGSHRCGRVDHEPIGGQQAANSKRVELLKTRFPTIPVVLNSGDAVFFHCNILHKSNANRSNRRRWAYLIAYNTKTNSSPIKHHCSQYVPIDVVPDIEIKKCVNISDLTGKEFMDVRDDKTIVAPYYVSHPTQYKV